MTDKQKINHSSPFELFPSHQRGQVQGGSRYRNEQAGEGPVPYCEIFENSIDGIAVIDLDGIYIKQNRAHRELFGYSDEDLRGRTPAIHLGEETFLEISQAMAGTGSYRGEVVSHTKNGDLLNIDLSVFTLKDDRGEPVCRVGVKRDITGRKQKEKALSKVRHDLERRVDERATELVRVDRQLKIETEGRKQAQVEIQRHTDMQDVINTLLMLSLEEVALKEILNRTIELITSIPWLSLKSKAGIFLAEDDMKTLTLKAHRNFPDPLQKLCARVPFGKCCCGRAALAESIVFSEFPHHMHEFRYEGMSLRGGHYCVPIRFKERLLGVFVLYVKEGHHRDEREEEFLMAVSNTLAGIIQRKSDENELRASEERFRLLVDGAREYGIFMLDPEGKIVTWNAGAERITGYRAEEAIGKHFSCFYTVEDINSGRPEEELRKAADKGRFEEEVRRVRKHGGEFWASVMITALRDEKGRLKGFSKMIRDTTKRKQAEETFRKSEAILRKVLRAAPFGIGLVKDRVMQWHNEAMSRMLGYESDEIFGQSARMIYPDDEEYHRAGITINGLGREKTTAEVETRWKRKDGSILDCRIRYALLDPESEEQVVLAIAEDITGRNRAQKEKERLQEQLRQSQKMEAIGTLAGGIAHDFNNILAAIMGYTQLSMMEVPNQSQAEGYLKEVLKASYRAKDLVRQILAFSRQAEERKEPLHIGLIVKEALKLLRASLPSTIEIRQHIEAKTGIVGANPTQIHQVLMNLCTNSAHAMRENGGILEVGLRNLEIGSSEADEYLNLPPGTYLRLSISDTGHGMSAEVRERVFDPYFTTKKKGDGTGLGLAVVHRIVKDHGGTITVYSEPGRGTTFHVYLPVIEHSLEPQKEIESPLPRGHERILFVDDEPTLVNIGKQMLEGLGYEVIARTSSIEGLQLFKAQPERFDLVITDMTMPHLTGDRLSQEIMKICPDIPVILCTGFSERITKQKAGEMGIKAFAMKPIVIQDLAMTVRKVLDQQMSGNGLLPDDDK